MSNIYPVFDGHNDALYYAQKSGYDFASSREVGSQISLPHLKKGNVKAAFWAVFTEPGLSQIQAYDLTIQQLRQYRQLIDTHADYLQLVTNRQELDTAHREGKIAVFLHIESFDGVDDHLTVLDEVYELGVRSIGFTWNHQNQLGAGATCDPGIGLTALGKDLIKAMNQRRMLIDVAHLNEAGFWQMVELSELPIIETHGNAFEICNNPRNLNNDQIQAIADKGGTVGVFFSNKFINGTSFATLDQVIDHINHLYEIGGAGLPAIGSDFGGILSGVPQDLENAGQLQNIFKRLEKLEYRPEEIEGIAFNNLMRVISEVLV